MLFWQAKEFMLGGRMSRERKILYIDMDGVLVDFQTGLDRTPEDEKLKYAEKRMRSQGSLPMKPKEGAIESFIKRKGI